MAANQLNRAGQHCGVSQARFKTLADPRRLIKI
jgi:hypothetical protein